MAAGSRDFNRTEISRLNEIKVTWKSPYWKSTSCVSACAGVGWGSRQRDSLAEGVQLGHTGVTVVLPG